ncbi:MAG: RHS repeat-associated core domain-containing protein [Acidobacteria bacterium]|nr:RHS repeat-associated core domain-containing protein [Acidobacteriota bacterium]
MLKSVAHGNGVTVTHGLDPHGMRRPGSIATSGVTGTPGNWDSGAYAYDGAGNVTRIGEEWYTYDLVSRLAAHRTGPQCQGNNESGYLYDPLGNMTMNYYFCGAGEGWGEYWPDPSTNRLAMQSYDASGNTLETVGAANFETLGYYPFNDLRSAVGTGLNRTYAYTADGERLVDYDVLANPPDGLFTVTLRDLGGKALRSFQVTTGQPGTWTEKEDWIYRDGQLLAAVDTTVQGGVARHFHLDHLGTPRLITSASGAGLESHTYLPFGLEVTDLGPLFERMKFTGHERDLASGLDYMHARYYSPYVNRFLSVDPGRDTDSERPQSWNLYSYARNNPVKHVDTNGAETTLFFVSGFPEHVFLSVSAAGGELVASPSGSHPDRELSWGSRGEGVRTALAYLRDGFNVLAVGYALAASQEQDLFGNLVATGRLDPVSNPLQSISDWGGIGGPYCSQVVAGEILKVEPGAFPALQVAETLTPLDPFLTPGSLLIGVLLDPRVTSVEVWGLEDVDRLIMSTGDPAEK